MSVQYQPLKREMQGPYHPPWWTSEHYFYFGKFPRYQIEMVVLLGATKTGLPVLCCVGRGSDDSLTDVRYMYSMEYVA